MFLRKSQHYAHVHKLWIIFGTLKKTENDQNNEISGFPGFCFLFCGFLRDLCGSFLRGFAGFLPDRLRRCKYVLSFVSPSPRTCNQSLKIEDLGVLGKISWCRSNSENTYIFLGFGGSRYRFHLESNSHLHLPQARNVCHGRNTDGFPISSGIRSWKIRIFVWKRMMLLKLSPTGGWMRCHGIGCSYHSISIPNTSNQKVVVIMNHP